MKKRYILIIFAFFSFVLFKKFSKKSIIIKTGLVSIKKANINVYYGPSHQHSKLYKTLHPNWPIFVIGSHKNWVKIQDKDGEIGWIREGNLGKPMAYVLKEIYIKTFIDEILIQPNCVIEFVEETDEKFCKIKVNNKIYQVECKNLWYKLV